MKFNLNFLGLYNMIIISLEIEYFEYYYIFPLLKEILNYQGYTLKLKYLKKLIQQALINTFQLTKWVFFFHKNNNKINFKDFFCKNLKIKNQKYKISFSLEKKKMYIKKNIINQCYLLNKNNYYLCKKKRNYEKKKSNQHLYNTKTEKLLKMSLFFSNYFQKKIKKKIRLKKNLFFFLMNVSNYKKKIIFFFF